MFPADLHRAERYWRCSLGERPCRELGLMCCDGAGELGVLVAGELLWEEAPGGRQKQKTERRLTQGTHPSEQISPPPAHEHDACKVVPRYECSGVERWP